MRNPKTPEERLLATIFDEEYRQSQEDLHRETAAKCARRLAKLLSQNAPAIIIAHELDILRGRLVEWIQHKQGLHTEAVCLIYGDDYEKVKQQLADDGIDPN